MRGRSFRWDVPRQLGEENPKIIPAVSRTAEPGEEHLVPRAQGYFLGPVPDAGKRNSTPFWVQGRGS